MQPAEVVPYLDQQAREIADLKSKLEAAEVDLLFARAEIEFLRGETVSLDELAKHKEQG